MPRHMRSRRRHNQLPEVSVVPLIDTALTLLVIFMITSPMMQNAIKINLPEGKAQEAKDHKQDIVVYVDATGHLFINGIPVSKQQLIPELKKMVGNTTQKTVFVKGDVDSNYGTIITLVDQIKVVGGIQYVALATQKLA